MRKVWMAVAATTLLSLPAMAAKADKPAAGAAAKAKAPVMGTISDISAQSMTVMHTPKGKKAAGEAPQAAQFTLNDTTLYAGLTPGSADDLKAQASVAVLVDANTDKPTAQGTVVWTGKAEDATRLLAVADGPLSARAKAGKGAKREAPPTVLIGTISAVTADSMTLHTADKDMVITLTQPTKVMVAAPLTQADLAKEQTVEVAQAIGGKARAHVASVVLRLPSHAARAAGGKHKGAK